jgi:hypothetical protein
MIPNWPTESVNLTVIDTWGEREMYSSARIGGKGFEDGILKMYK